MRRPVALLAAAALAGIGCAAALAGETAPLVTEAIPMRFVKPSEFVRRVAAPVVINPAPDGLSVPPPGIDQMSPDDAAMTLTIRGRAGDVARLREIARLLDVRPREVRLQMRLLRFRFPPGFPAQGGAPEVEELFTLTARAANNVPVTLTAVGERRVFQIGVQPRINGDDSVTVFLEVKTPDKAPNGTIYRRLSNGVRGLLLVGKEKEVVPPGVEVDEYGNGLPRTGAPTDLYVEVVPTVLPAADAGGKEKKKP